MNKLEARQINSNGLCVLHLVGNEWKITNIQVHSVNDQEIKKANHPVNVIMRNEDEDCHTYSTYYNK